MRSMKYQNNCFRQSNGIWYIKITLIKCYTLTVLFFFIFSTFTSMLYRAGIVMFCLFCYPFLLNHTTLTMVWPWPIEGTIRTRLYMFITLLFSNNKTDVTNVKKEVAKIQKSLEYKETEMAAIMRSNDDFVVLTACHLKLFKRNWKMNCFRQSNGIWYL